MKEALPFHFSMAFFSRLAFNSAQLMCSLGAGLASSAGKGSKETGNTLTQRHIVFLYISERYKYFNAQIYPHLTVNIANELDFRDNVSFNYDSLHYQSKIATRILFTHIFLRTNALIISNVHNFLIETYF